MHVLAPGLGAEAGPARTRASKHPLARPDTHLITQAHSHNLVWAQRFGKAKHQRLIVRIPPRRCQLVAPHRHQFVVVAIRVQCSREAYYYHLLCVCLFERVWGTRACLRVCACACLSVCGVSARSPLPLEPSLCLSVCQSVLCFRLSFCLSVSLSARVHLHQHCVRAKGCVFVRSLATMHDEFSTIPSPGDRQVRV